MFYDLFQTQVTYLHIALYAAFGLSVLVQLCIYLGKYFRFAAYKEKKRTYTHDTPPVTVVICAKNEAENLEKNLPDILNQDYPDFQVVVVNDCSDDETEDVLKRFCAAYPHLYVTKIFPDPYYKHGKKLAQSIGIKAAKNDWLLFTDADCKPVSNQWIRLMMRNFTPGIELVLGYGPFTRENGALNYKIRYNNIFTAMQYFSYALKGKAYMGVGRNMAYHKSLFFERGGFKGHTHVLSGDDDLFVTKVATKTNVAIEVNPQSWMYSKAPESNEDWAHQRRRHLLTAPYYKSGIKRSLATEVVFRGFLYFFFVAVMALAPYRIITSSAMFMRMLFFYIAIGKTGRKLGHPRYFPAAVWFDITLPLASLRFYLLNKFSRKRNIW